MAKKQAKRSNSRSGGTPAWLWGLMGIGLGLVIAAYFFMSDYFKSNTDDQPRPNAAAEAPAVSNNSEPVVQEQPEKPKPKYDFYELLPGKEVVIPDADLEAQAEAEARAARIKADADKAAAQQAAQASAGSAANNNPVNSSTKPPIAAPANAPVNTPPASAPVADNKPTATPATAESPVSEARFLIQAGAFKNVSEAENLKATIAMTGEIARIESAEINGTTVYRVRLGPYASASSLSSAKQALSTHGIEAQAIKVK
jgi:cell division protein FtsN